MAVAVLANIVRHRGNFSTVIGRPRFGAVTPGVQGGLRDESNYAGPTINRTARLRDLGHGGQTVLSGATEAMVVDRLPAAAWLTDLGTHPLRDLPRPERVVQLCHPDLSQRLPAAPRIHRRCLPAFSGAAHQFCRPRRTDDPVGELFIEQPAGDLDGCGRGRQDPSGIQIAARIAGEFGDGVWYVDLAPLTHPALVAVAVARAFGLPDQPGHSTLDTLARFVRDRHMLIVLDNCEHLLDASAELIIALLARLRG